MNKQIVFLLLCLPFAAFSQNGFEVGLFGGFANYQGDLSASQIEFSETKVSFGGFLRYHVNEKIKIKANAYLGFISGDDANDKDGGLRNRGWSFESSLLEVAAVGEYHPFGKARYGSTGIFQRQLSPYVFAGVGMVKTDPAIKVSNPVDESLFPEEGFSSTFLSVPFGFGLRADLVEGVSLGLEGGWRLTFNDYLDGVSQYGNSDKNDLYIFVGASISYVFPSRQESLDF